MKKLFALMLAALLALGLTSALAENTAAKAYTVEEMIAWAIQDEVNAEAVYQAILNAFGAQQRPFSAIVKAEQTHQALLAPLMEKYGVTKPAPAQVAAPATFEEALQMGIVAEEENIAMYQAFLAQGNLPEDVAAVFLRLSSASENHLAAFTRVAGRAAQPGQGRNSRWNDSTQTPGSRGNQGNQGNRGNRGNWR
jgi:hypothetical protein